MFCPECGTKLTEEARFCPECGSSVGIKIDKNPDPVQTLQAEPLQIQVQTDAQEPKVEVCEQIQETSEETVEENMEDVDSFMFLEAVEDGFSEEESDFFAVKEEAEPLYVPDNEDAADVSVQKIVGTEDVVPANIDDTSLEEVKLSDLQDVYIEDTQPIDLRGENTKVNISSDTPVAEKENKPPTEVKSTPVKANLKRVKAPGEIKTKAVFSVILVVFYAAAAFLAVSFPFAENALTIKASADVAYTDSYSVAEILGVMTSGNDYFNPTSLSVALGVAVYVFLFAVPVVALVALVTSVINRRFYSLHILFVTVTTLAAGAVAAFMPVVLEFAPGFEQAVMRSKGMFVQQVKSLIFATPIIYAGLLMACVVGTFVVTLIFNQRRKRYEK